MSTPRLHLVSQKKSAIVGSCVLPEVKRALMRECGPNETLSSHVAKILERHVGGKVLDPEYLIEELRRLLRRGARDAA